MSRLYDRIMAEGFELPPGILPERVKELVDDLSDLQEATVIDASNTACYFAERESAGKDWKLTDFPSIVPPFPNVWTEFATPYKGRSQDCGATAAGVWIRTYDLADFQDATFPVPARFLSQDDLETGEATWWSDEDPSIGWHDGVRWLVDALIWIEEGTRIFGPVHSTRYFLGTDGRNYLRGGRAISYVIGDIPKDKVRMQSIVLGRHVLYPCWLTISFMHCKNVTLTVNDAPEKLQRARVKRGKKPLVRYYTLEIEPMKQVLRTEGNIEKNGLKKALHICRGHFSEYGDEYGKGKLFGKLEGRYWMPAHVRGRLSEGAVVKDYAVKPPKRADE